MISQLTPLLAKTIVEERIAAAAERRRAPAPQPVRTRLLRIAPRLARRRAARGARAEA